MGTANNTGHVGANAASEEGAATAECGGLESIDLFVGRNRRVRARLRDGVRLEIYSVTGASSAGASSNTQGGKSDSSDDRDREGGGKVLFSTLIVLVTLKVLNTAPSTASKLQRLFTRNSTALTSKKRDRLASASPNLVSLAAAPATTTATTSSNTTSSNTTSSNTTTTSNPSPAQNNAQNTVGSTESLAPSSKNSFSSNLAKPPFISRPSSPVQATSIGLGLGISLAALPAAARNWSKRGSLANANETGNVSSTSVTERIHFQLITPTQQQPMFALSMADFTRLRTLIDLHRMAALAGDTLFTTNLEATPHSCCNGTSAGMSQPSTSYSKDSLDLPTLDAASLHIPPANATGPVLLQWLRARDRSNRRCGACGESNPPPTWAAVMRAPAPPPVGAGAGAGTGDAMALAEVPVRAALLVCDACGGFYRGLPFFAVRSFLLDVSVFEDATTDLYKQVTSISNRAACLALAETPTHSYTLRLYFTTIGDNTNDNDDADSPDLHSTPISARHLAVTSAATAGHHTRRASDHGLDYTFMPTPSASSSEAAPTESRWSPRALRLTARPGGLFSRMMHRGSATRAATLTSTTATTTTEVATPALHLPVATASHEELKRSGATGESFEFPGSTEVGVAWAPGTVGAASLRRASFSSVSPSVTGGRVLDEVFGESGSLRREGSLGRGREGSLGSPTGSVPTVVGIVSGGVKKMSVQRRMQVASIPNVEFS